MCEAIEKRTWTQNAWTDDLQDLQTEINTLSSRNAFVYINITLTKKKDSVEFFPVNVLLY